MSTLTKQSTEICPGPNNRVDTYLWKIKNFYSICSKNTDRTIKPSSFGPKLSDGLWGISFSCYLNTTTFKLDHFINKKEGSLQTSFDITVINKNSSKNIQTTEKNINLCKMEDKSSYFCSVLDINLLEIVRLSPSSWLTDDVLTILIKLVTVHESLPTKNNHQLISGLLSCLQNEKFSDIVLEVDGKELKAHKMILMSTITKQSTEICPGPNHTIDKYLWKIDNFTQYTRGEIMSPVFGPKPSDALCAIAFSCYLNTTTFTLFRDTNNKECSLQTSFEIAIININSSKNIQTTEKNIYLCNMVDESSYNVCSKIDINLFEVVKLDPTSWLPNDVLTISIKVVRVLKSLPTKINHPSISGLSSYLENERFNEFKDLELRNANLAIEVFRKLIPQK
ncbi:hypothetical protein HCN44_005284 [Aphidius gifuensis]|uniref:Uncharacterized protein n=1 Tax=Aphidius gifuensis TaxID=684658 RepID=A0A835CV18_APHGI|nr:hypothetical protein HCN44_005284 [Aphidius gifuensis]